MGVGGSDTLAEHNDIETSRRNCGVTTFRLKDLCALVSALGKTRVRSPAIGQ